MAFKIKDLMIQTLPEMKATCNPTFCITPSCACISKAVLSQITVCHFCASMVISPCPCGSHICSGSITKIYSPYCPIEGPVIDWPILKEELKQVLVEVEKQERLTEAALKPHTVAEAEALEKQLSEALAEVTKIKETLKKG